MKITALTTALVLATSTAFAGTLGSTAMDAPTPVMAPTEPAGSGALGWIIPLVAIAAIALAADD